jgi:hypothetical protein
MIPHKLHFIFGLTPNFGGKPFSFVHWAAIRSAQLANPGWETTVWVKYIPTGRYWDAIIPHVQVKHVRTPDFVYGNEIRHVAHKCDWLRLQILRDHGGVYLDMDTITVKGFDTFVTPPVSMVAETANGSTIGLCNAFIAAEPEAEFIHDWIEKFRGFRSVGHDEYWNESAVKWPHELYQGGGDCFAFLPSNFMIPDWTHDGLAAMFNRVESFPRAYGHHLWESFSWEPYLSRYTPENYRDFHCTYSRLLNEVLANEIRSDFSL